MLKIPLKRLIFRRERDSTFIELKIKPIKMMRMMMMMMMMMMMLMMMMMMTTMMMTLMMTMMMSMYKYP